MSDEEVGECCVDAFLHIDVVNEAYENFWSKKQLGVDADGKVYRTELDRKRPKSKSFGNHNWMFDKNKGVKVQVDNKNDSN